MLSAGVVASLQVDSEFGLVMDVRDNRYARSNLMDFATRLTSVGSPILGPS